MKSNEKGTSKCIIQSSISSPGMDSPLSPLLTCFPSGLTTMLVGAPLRSPPMILTQSPLATSHSLTLRSEEAVAT